jgi:acyl-CoA dehydrogenase
MSWEFETEPEFERQLHWMRDFVKNEVEPLETLTLDWEQLKAVSKPLQDRVKDQGLWAAHLGPELGGPGFGQVKLGLMHEIIGRSVRAPLIFGNQAPDSGNSEILALAGTPEQKARWLRPLLDGEYRSCFAMTELDVAGSDPTLIQTRAVQDGDEWVITGKKWFASHASVADFFIVMVVTDPQAAAHRRASMLIVPADTPGVEVLRDIATIEHPQESFGLFGNHAEVLFDEVRVPADALLGKPGDGFTIAQERLGPGRIHHCMRWIGQANRAFEMLCERATYRFSHGSTLGEKGEVRAWIANSAAEIQAARLMTLHAAWKMDRYGVKAARTDIQMIKYFGAKVLNDVVDRALQAHGSLGYTMDMPLESMYRHARGARFYDGPDEVHRDSVARRILGGFQPPPDLVPTEHVPTRRIAAEQRYPEMVPAR